MSNKELINVKDILRGELEKINSLGFYGYRELEGVMESDLTHYYIHEETKESGNSLVLFAKVFNVFDSKGKLKGYPNSLVDECVDYLHNKFDYDYDWLASFKSAAHLFRFTMNVAEMDCNKNN